MQAAKSLQRCFQQGRIGSVNGFSLFGECRTVSLDKPFLAELQQVGVIPVISLSDASLAEPLAHTLVQAGLPVAEVTFRTRAAAEGIATMRRVAPQMRVGAGTVLTPQDVDRAVDAGAQFALAPGLVVATLERARERGLDFIPGVMTASDIGLAHALGVKEMKFFPAVPAGGPKLLSALAAPHAHLGLRFIPTGGITPDTASEWLAMDSVLAIGGSWIVSDALLRSADWESISANARKAVGLSRGA